MESHPERKALPHLAPLEFPNQTIVQFVTVCTKDRRPLLARPETVRVILDAWTKADHWLIGRWVVMPDHLHLFCAPQRGFETPLRDWVLYWRSEITRHWPHPAEKPIWQRDFFDRQLRRGESYRQKWLYIWNNPENANLVRQQDWPYQGEMNRLQWHDAS
jgi:REP element-mobilizing transposase RayT